MEEGGDKEEQKEEGEERKEKVFLIQKLFETDQQPIRDSDT